MITLKKDDVIQHMNYEQTEDTGIWYYDNVSDQFLVWEGLKEKCPGVLMPYEEDLVSLGDILDELDLRIDVEYNRYQKGVMRRIRDLGLYDIFLGAKYELLEKRVEDWISTH